MASIRKTIDQLLCKQERELFMYDTDEFDAACWPESEYVNMLKQLGISSKGMCKDDMISVICDLVSEYEANQLPALGLHIADNLPVVANDWCQGLPDTSEQAKKMLEDERTHDNTWKTRIVYEEDMGELAIEAGVEL